MYYFLLVFHSILRWFAVCSLLLTIVLAALGYLQKKPFSRLDNLLRHGTATLFHVQLIIGMLLYAKSPITQYFWQDTSVSWENIQLAFFGLIHPAFMLLAIVIITIGSAKAKRMASDQDKFKTVFGWYTFALLLLVIAIPWFFSPFVSRPNFRFY